MDKSKRAVLDYFGTQENAAKALGITRQAVCLWNKVPPERAIQIEKVTHKKLTRQMIRPDFFE